MPDVKRIQFIEEINEFNHLLIMESLGGDQSWYVSSGAASLLLPTTQSCVVYGHLPLSLSKSLLGASRDSCRSRMVN
jgi:hypothetical protein